MLSSNFWEAQETPIRNAKDPLRTQQLLDLLSNTSTVFFRH